MNYRNTTFNSMAFTPDEVRKGLLDKFVRTLNDLNQEKEQGFIEYHVTTDGFCTIVEFDDLFIQDEDDKFQYVDENGWKDAEKDWESEDIALTEEEKELAAKHCKKNTDTIEEVEDDTPCCENREESEEEPFLEDCTEEEWHQYINGLWTKIAKLHVHN